MTIKNIIPKVNMKLKILLLLFFLYTIGFAQSFNVNKIEPPNWWEGMKTDQIQLMVYGENLGHVEVKSSGLKITQVHKVKNRSYLFVDIDLSGQKSGNYQLIFFDSDENVDITYPILKRERTINRQQGFSNEDVIYLIMPDRFANGDTANDEVEGYKDSMQDQFTQARHGGDIQGVIDHLDYLKDLGITTVWLTPLVENNTFRSYHGYSATDFYKIDPRLGNIDLYKTLVSKAHDKDLKIIMDHVSNHISIDHPWIKDLPTPDWINGTVKDHLSADHHKMVYTDPHADSTTIEHVYKGWFVDYMPDLNQANRYLGNYIIQNTIWWIETSGVDGIREDTYPYCNQEFMSRWAKAVMNEYSDFNIVGEVWTGEPAFLSGYQGGNKLRDFDTNLPAVTDFGMRDALGDFLKGNKNIDDFYNLLTKDYLYPDSDNLVTFIDNHDIGRAMFQADTNIAKFKIAFHMLLTTRGIPQILYGTEIGMIENDDHGTLRKNFPGGFPKDDRNAFTESGRTEYENDIFYFFQKILTLRQDHPALSKGKLIHFPVVDNVYIYFKIFDDELILNVINTNEYLVEIDMNKYSQIIKNRNSFTDLLSAKHFDLKDKIKIKGMKAEMFLIE
ncbi:Neopullulanase [hydrothermal vent metagenome]|uniref:Neopullulanase n=1 Tax=hydrothermal vent metagenome TaxID=652676 RepID=A0A3B1CD28_9ZZZZ